MSKEYVDRWVKPLRPDAEQIVDFSDAGKAPAPVAAR